MLKDLHTFGSRMMFTGAFGVTICTRISWATLGLTFRQGHGKYKGISLKTILLPPSFPIPVLQTIQRNTTHKTVNQYQLRNIFN